MNKTSPLLQTGFRDFDSLTQGLRPGQVVLLGGRPGMGKTSFLQSVLTHVCVDQEKNAFFLSLELSEIEIRNQMCARLSRLEMKRIKNHELSPEKNARYLSAKNKLHQAKLHIDDSASQRVSSIETKCRALMENSKKLDLIAIDYFQLLNGEGLGTLVAPIQEIGEVLASLKKLSKDLAVPVIVLSQVSREIESRENKRPKLTDLRGIKDEEAILRSLDLVCFLYREDYYGVGANSGTAELIVAQNSMGKLGTVPLKWTGKYAVFENTDLIVSP